MDYFLEIKVHTYKYYNGKLQNFKAIVAYCPEKGDTFPILQVDNYTCVPTRYVRVNGRNIIKNWEFIPELPDFPHKTHSVPKVYDTYDGGKKIQIRIMHGETCGMQRARLDVYTLLDNQWVLTSEDIEM